jgi:hypothetical protein
LLANQREREFRQITRYGYICQKSLDNFFFLV